MSPTGDAARRVWLLAPVGRDARLGCAALGEAGIDCHAGRAVADLETVSLEDVGALVLTEEALTGPAVAVLSERLAAPPAWSSLAVILLVDPEHARRAGAAASRLRPLLSRPGTVLLQRPTQEETLVSVVRSAVADRHRQFELRDELEAREAAEARAQTLAQEMQHRVKNTYALALSIARQSFRGAETLADALEAFTGRLEAMVRAQDLLAPGRGDVVDLRELLDRTLAPHRPTEDPERIAGDGPKVLIPREKATALSMAFHELATNAAKYGALSTGTGHVDLRWTVNTAADGDELTLEWRERGGPPVQPPTRRGFGSLLIKQALSRDLNGSTDLTFDPSGAVCTIQALIPATGG
ncbi:sensor histidine kinase [uncultured Jannaschia sp.]|uniref:sensor histidine kinase n=1 Tax=uncultured Jannaschia sp. TaxID=293347 RepID=UPI0026205752|nr:sensor histidine kinase [uncultured Jannaschia sp.]